MKLQSKVEIKIVGKSINVHLFSNATLNNYNLSLCVTHLALKKKSHHAQAARRFQNETLIFANSSMVF